MVSRSIRAPLKINIGGTTLKLHAGMAACIVAGGMSWAALCLAQQSDPDERQRTQAFSRRGPPALQAAVESAWQRALGARESEAERRRAQAERDAARRPWAAPPALEILQRDDRLQSNAGRRETEMAVTWPLWLPGQRAANHAAAQSAVDRADTAQRAARLQVAGSVREAAWRLIAERAERDQLAGQVDVLRKLLDDVERRVRAGDLARADALAARAELLAASAQAADAEQRIEQARIRWHELTGIEAAPEPGTIAEPGDASSVQSEHPELVAAAGSVEHARRRLVLVRASSRDAPELKLGMRQDVSGGVEGTHNSLAVGIRVPFGTGDRNRPLEVAALGELDVAQRFEQRLRDRIRADIAAARAALQAASNQRDVEKERTQLLRERAGLLERAFRAGETALPELLRALGASSQAQGAAARQEVSVGYARARLQQAIGILP